MSLPKLTLFFVVLFVSLMVAVPTQGQDALQGQWRGGWQSCNTGHRGRLNASFCRVDATHVRANFTGTFAKIIPFRYRPILDVVHEEPGLLVIQGSKRLPLMGSFEYQAVVSGGHFEATYRSRRDHGVWRMQR